MISIESLRFSYPQDGFNLQIPAFSVPVGQKLAVIGPSGSGKTTLLNLIAGIVAPDTGRIQVAGVPVHEITDAGRRDFRITQIGFVFQDFELLDYLSVLDNILHPYRITRALQLTPAVARRARELAEQMGIGDKLQRHAGDLSQGEKQRAAMPGTVATTETDPGG